MASFCKAKLSELFEVAVLEIEMGFLQHYQSYPALPGL